MTIAISGVSAHDARPWFSSNQTATAAITSPPARSLTQPSNYFKPTTGHLRNLPNGVIGSGGRGICVYPYGTGADNSTFDFAIIGWVKQQVTATDGNTKAVYEYSPFYLTRYTATLSTVVGLENGFGTSTRMADTLVEDAVLAAALDAFTGLTTNVYSPADNVFQAFTAIEDASHIFDGFTPLIDRDAGGGTAATDCNLLVQIIQ